MAAEASTRARFVKLSRRQWVLLLMLVLSNCINYVDRGSLSVAQKMISGELGIDTQHLGMLFSAFFWTYAGLQIFSGTLVDRFDVNRVYAIGYFVWSAAMLMCGFATGITSLLVLRLVLGTGESVTYPSFSRFMATGYREEQRGFANALIDAGSKIGPAVGVLLGGLLMERFGWRAFFVGMGAASLLWLWPWSRIAPKATDVADPERNPARNHDAPSIGRILKLRQAWGTLFGLFCSNYAWYFMVFWIPPYLVNERHFTHHEMSVFGSIPYWGVAATSVTGGWLSDRWIASGASVTLVRKTFTGCGLLASSLMLPAMMVQDNAISLGLLTIACASFGFYSSNVWAVTQTLATPVAAGKWTGLQNAFGNIPGMLGLWFTGWVIQETGRYFGAFVIASIFLLLGASCYFFVIRRVEPVDWSRV